MNARDNVGGPGGQRRDRLIQEHEHDSYKRARKPAEPTACPGCGAVFQKGRWCWGTAPEDAPQLHCPACLHIRDDYPAGTLTLTGEFARAHADEIAGLLRNVQKRESQDHPLKRIMAIEHEGDALVVTTTDLHLARGLGDAIHSAYGGTLDYVYAEEGDQIRISWNR